MKHLIRTMALSLLVSASFEIEAKAQELKWTPEIMMSMQQISDVQVSPNQKCALFVATENQVKEVKGSSSSHIYKKELNSQKPAELFSSADLFASNPKWSPDGQWIAFLTAKEGVRNLSLISSEGGLVKTLTSGSKSVQAFAWSPDGTSIAFAMNDETEAEKKRTKTSLAIVYDEKTTVNRLWILDPFSADPDPKPLTDDNYCVRFGGDFGSTSQEFDWSPDSKQIVFAYSPSIKMDDFYLESSLAILNLATGTVTTLENDKPFEALPKYSPDGKWIAYLSWDSSERYAINRRVSIRSIDNLKAIYLAPTFNEGPLLIGASLLGWTKDSKSILFFEPKGTKFHLVLVPIDGTPSKEVETGDCFFKDPTWNSNLKTLGFTLQSPSSPPEAYIAEIEAFKPQQLSNLNSHLLIYPKAKTEIVSWKSSDGQKIEGLLTYPTNYTSHKAYPLLVVIHGGPMGFFDESFIGTPYPYPLAAFADAGFMIFRPNPRGSTGYGRAFRCANYFDWGGMDYQDIITGVDDLIAKGIADPERLGIMGWSYGGFMTSWAVSQTPRFKAASMGAGLYNLISMVGTTDLSSFMSEYMGDFLDYLDHYISKSAIFYAQTITTPCLIQHGTEDQRVSVTQAYEFYHALKRSGKEVTLLIYPGMGHRLPDPNMIRDAMKSNLDWFEKYLK